MKKFVSLFLIAGLILICPTTAQAMTGNSIQSVKALQAGDQVVEGVEIGQSMKDVFKEKGQGIHTMATYSDEQYYEYHTEQGLLRITANHDKANAKVIRISMSYNEPTGPSYRTVQKHLSSNAIQREHYNNITGNTGYIVDGKVSYQFTTKQPKDKKLKLYRIDIEA
ncbi:SA0570 family protein [Staphylococcus sp. 17KM0847]|uniref:SA0570 family protein n=1 Tax=Staphylococcus sp. 17KM0847 TaxID=2583989 RepID=UPI0015DD1DC9|nr:hypothetical protein [Staphylococcus sp. 17KM0847]QLK85409.1 hypothetical protein FGL66_01185 [Staphylococcus sp. 17KM0847]